MILFCIHDKLHRHETILLNHREEDGFCIYDKSHRYEKRKIKFQNKECWYINAYYEEELKFFDLNTFDKIVIGSDVPEDFVKKVAAKVKDHSTIRVCDLKTAINKIGGY